MCMPNKNILLAPVRYLFRAFVILLPALIFSANALAQTTNPCTGVNTVSITTTMPTNFSALAQTTTNAACLAWQEFVYLNWKANAKMPGTPDSSANAKAFGLLGTAPTVWESYMEVSSVFAPLVPMRWGAARAQHRQLSRLSKFGNRNIQEASGGWLTSQTGFPTYYEVLFNQDEYEFVTQNGLTTMGGQAACASGKAGLILPSGSSNSANSQDYDCQGNPATYGQNIGAIEIKAAWMVLTDPALGYRYKTTQATLKDPVTRKTILAPNGRPKIFTLGLVGLHIIHKMPGANQFVWATFEQIDNTPNDNSGNPAPPALPPNPNRKARTTYNYYNAACDKKTDPYQCATNNPPVKACGAIPTPGCTAYSAPMQITRMTPVQGDADSVNAYAWSLLQPGSVFNYYRLIDVQWPSAPTAVTAGTPTCQMPSGAMIPSHNTRFVANTTLESYVQTQLSCTDCHRTAPIMQSNPIAFPCVTASAPYASDYSFIFSTETVR